MATKEEIIAFQDRLAAKFSHNGIIGGRLLQSVLNGELAIGSAFDKRWHGHRVLTDSFQEFFAETLEEQFALNNRIGWPQQQPNYSSCLMMFLTVFRSIRSAEILSVNAYALRAYAIQRSIKDQLWILCGAANHMASFGDLFGWEGLGGGEWSEEQKKKQFSAQLKTENEMREKICGKQSELSDKTQQQLLNWERMFNKEVHRGLFSLFRASQRLHDGHYGLELVPPTDDLADSMFLNRSLETNWLALRLLPFMRRADTPKNATWNEKWVLLDESFAFMFKGFTELGKAIAPAFEEMLSAKFNFNSDNYYAELEAKAVPAQK